jgi:hypothetical protein
MWSIQDVSAEELARLFYHYQGALAHNFEGLDRNAGRVSWERTSQEERKRMVAAARLALLELATTTKQEGATRSFFAKPGEAEWGC